MEFVFEVRAQGYFSLTFCTLTGETEGSSIQVEGKEVHLRVLLAKEQSDKRKEQVRYL